MMKLKLLFLACILPISAFAQISSIEYEIKKTSVTTPSVSVIQINAYDSLTNVFSFKEGSVSYQMAPITVKYGLDSAFLYMDIQSEDRNLAGLDVKKMVYQAPLGMYVGQELFFLPVKSNAFQYRKYFCPLTDNTKEGFSPEADYLCIQSESELTGNTYKITDFFVNTEGPEKWRAPYFILENVKDTTKYIWRIDSLTNNINEFPAVFSLGYLQKLKEKYIGQKYTFSPYLLSIYQKVPDYNPAARRNFSHSVDELIPVTAGEIWTCIDIKLVTLTTVTFSVEAPKLVLTNERGDIMLASYSSQDFDFSPPGSWLKFFSIEPTVYTEEDQKLYQVPEICYEMIAAQDYLPAKQERSGGDKLITDEKQEAYERLAGIYGPRHAQLISEQKVEMGMSREACKASWGEPALVNKTTTAKTIYEQWLYPGNRCLYFENGKLKTIQE